jgi:hypothetical protein
MRPRQEHFLEMMREERAQLSSRRTLLKGGAMLAGGGALALAMTGIAGSRSTRMAAAQEFTDDLDILNYALTLEHLEHAFYRDGLAQFDEAAFADRFGDDDDDSDDDDDDDDATPEVDDDTDSATAIRVALEEIRDHEEAHVQALSDTITQLGGTPVEEGEYDFGYGDDLDAFLQTAQALENTGVAAYAGAAPSISDPALLATALGIHSVEARHAAYLNLRNGLSAFPEAVDAPLTPDEVLEIAGPFIVSATGAATTVTAGAESTAELGGGTQVPAPEETTAPGAPAPTEESAPPAETEPPAPAPTGEPAPAPTEEPAPAPTEEPVEPRTPQPRTSDPRTPAADETPDA